MSRTLTFALLICAAACGGKSRPAAAPATASEHAHEGSGSGAMQEEHAGMPAELTAFHDLLAPHFHAADGPQRLQDTCAAIDQFRSTADAGEPSCPITSCRGLCRSV